MCPNSICKDFRVASPGGWAQSCLEPESLLPDVSPKVDRLPDPASNLFPDDSLKEDEHGKDLILIPDVDQRAQE